MKSEHAERERILCVISPQENAYSQTFVRAHKEYLPAKIKSLYAKDYDLVIATRMHVAILALSVGTPVLPIAYEFKMRGLFERLAQGRWVQDIEAMSADALIDAVDQFLEALPDIRESLFTAVQKEHENAVASGRLVRQAFEEWRRAREK